MGDDRTGGVEHDGVPDRALGTGQHRTRLGRIGLRVATQQVVEVSTRKPESRGIKSQPVHRARLHPPDGARSSGGQLVEPVVAVHNEHAGAARSEYPRHHLGEVGERAADQPSPRPGRISKRSKEIENSGHPELAAHRGRVPIQRVEHRREAEPDPHLGEAARDLVGSEVDAYAECLQRVGAAGQRGRRPVAVFDHRHACGRNHNRRHGGQVDRVDAIAAGTDDVDGVVADSVVGHLARVAQHDVGQLTDLGRGGNLHLHRHRESCDLSRPRVAGHDLVHGPGGLSPGQVLSARQTTQNLWP